jgi:metal-dependent amidase/aminoacylase/carboxypeptidase family protein
VQVPPELAQQVLDWHEWLDAHPEPAWRETATTAYLVEQLETMGFDLHLTDGRTGALAELGGGPRWIAVRADLDAIWTGDGEGCAVHSCGHSAHMAAVLGCASLLSGARLPDSTSSTAGRWRA